MCILCQTSCDNPVIDLIMSCSAKSGVIARRVMSTVEFLTVEQDKLTESIKVLRERAKENSVPQPFEIHTI